MNGPVVETHMASETNGGRPAYEKIEFGDRQNPCEFIWLLHMVPRIPRTLDYFEHTAHDAYERPHLVSNKGFIRKARRQIRRKL